MPGVAQDTSVPLLKRPGVLARRGAVGRGSSAAGLAPVHVRGAAKSKRVGDRDPLASGAGGSGDPDPHLEASSEPPARPVPVHCPVSDDNGRKGTLGFSHRHWLRVN